MNRPVNLPDGDRHRRTCAKKVTVSALRHLIFEVYWNAILTWLNSICKRKPLESTAPRAAFKTRVRRRNAIGTNQPTRYRRVGHGQTTA